jgi:hypothetical protein
VVRIHFPPALNPLRTSFSGEKRGKVRGDDKGRRASSDRTIAETIVLAGASATTIAAVVAAMTLIASRREAAALSVYSRQTGFCKQCHAGGGKLTAFGEEFKANGDRLPAPNQR